MKRIKWLSLFAEECEAEWQYTIKIDAWWLVRLIYIGRITLGQ